MSPSSILPSVTIHFMVSSSRLSSGTLIRDPAHDIFIAKLMKDKNNKSQLNKRLTYMYLK